LAAGEIRLLYRLGRRSHRRVHPGSVLVALSVPEIRPSTFDVALRVRRLGEVSASTVDAIYVTRVADRHGALQPVPRWLRDELIEVEHTAAEFC
jgi:hypothetical protein